MVHNNVVSWPSICYINSIMSSQLVIHESLVLAPSWRTSVRDLTLWVHLLMKAESFVECSSPEMRDGIVKYLREGYAHDYISDFLLVGELRTGVHIAQNNQIVSVTPHTLPHVMRVLARQFR